jgi:hypothetical protein
VRRAVIVALAACALAPGAAAARPAGEPSGPLTPKVRAVERDLGALEAQAEPLESSADDYDDWSSCIETVPVSEYGDPDNAFGYGFDARDGSRTGRRSALAVDRDGRADYRFLRFARDAGCRSDAPWPGGTAEPAAAAATGLRGRVARLERRVRRLERLTRRLERMASRFDAWESCVSAIPVTQYGDPGGDFGYLFGRKGDATPRYRPALAIDRSDRDDPDYFLLAFVGADDPGGECRDEPGEAPD